MCYYLSFFSEEHGQKLEKFKKKKCNNWNHVLVLQSLFPGNLHCYFDVVNNLVSNEDHFYWSSAAFNKDCVGILVFSQRHLTQTNAFYFILALLQPHSSHSVKLKSTSLDINEYILTAGG